VRRFVVLIPTLYLLVFVWETRLSQEPSVTRLIFVGVLLIVLMIYRPNGLLGQRRVEIA
jgi:ABC-type branched-subunit amino acid transport system permease subunit